MQTATAYICEHCNHIASSKQNALKHESECYMNPANKTCATCKHNPGYIVGNNWRCEKIGITRIANCGLILYCRHWELA